MSDTFDKLVYTHDFANGNVTIDLGQFKNYDKVTLSLKWTGVDAADAAVVFKQRSDNASAWITSGTLSTVLATIPASEAELANVDFNSNHVGVEITKNTATVGVLFVSVIAKQK